MQLVSDVKNIDFSKISIEFLCCFDFRKDASITKFYPIRRSVPYL